MFQRRMPEWLRHAPVPGVRGFAVLAGAESAARGILISVFPIIMYRNFGDARTISEVYFLIGLLSFTAALLMPFLSRYIPRQWLYTIATLGMIMGALCAMAGGALMVSIGLGVTTTATVILTVCLNAYVMDYIHRQSLGECETRRLFYSGAAWTLGPFLGVWLLDWWEPAPFILSAVAAATLLVIFWILRLGNGKVITRARAHTPNPLAYLHRFFSQPRLIAGWTFAVIRSCAWWVYVVYLPIYALENGFGDTLGGLMLSITNGFLFLTPFMLRWMKGRVRYAIRTGFFCSGTAFLFASLFYQQAQASLAFLLLGSFFLILLDICAGLPFLMAVRPSERTEMSAVYSTYRDVSAVVSPSVARIVLAVAPLTAVFTATALGLYAAGLIASRLHPRLGIRREPVKATSPARS